MPTIIARRRPMRTGLAVWGIAALGVQFLLGALAGREPASKAAAPLDVLVVAPHPDDEALGCAGVLLRALEQKQRVGVVLVTNGDGFPRAAAVVAKKSESALRPA